MGLPACRLISERPGRDPRAVTVGVPVRWARFWFAHEIVGYTISDLERLGDLEKESSSLINESYQSESQ